MVAQIVWFVRQGLSLKRYQPYRLVKDRQYTDKPNNEVDPMLVEYARHRKVCKSFSQDQFSQTTGNQLADFTRNSGPQMPIIPQILKQMFDLHNFNEYDSSCAQYGHI
jgi:hypothetical protein